MTVVGNAVTSVGAYAFRGSPVSSLTLPELEEIGAGAFANCTSLGALTLTFDHLKSVGSQAFASVMRLQIYTRVADAVIDPSAFSWNSSIEIIP